MATHEIIDTLARLPLADLVSHAEAIGRQLELANAIIRHRRKEEQSRERVANALAEIEAEDAARDKKLRR